MKHKYVVSRSGNNNQLTIKEYAELDKEIFTLVYQVSYDVESLIAAASQGKVALMSMLRTQNFFPPKLILDRLTEATIKFIESDAQELMEFCCDDTDYLVKKQPAAQLSDDAVSIDTVDDLLDDNSSGDVADDLDTDALETDDLENDIKSDKIDIALKMDGVEPSSNDG
ncbi:MAG: hypothetical protein JRH15_09690 [Deltaproteobacteria bacterium]|nr:hypothetical protein [Deltaproteobacteria bacterium]